MPTVPTLFSCIGSEYDMVLMMLLSYSVVYCRTRSEGLFSRAQIFKLLQSCIPRALIRILRSQQVVDLFSYIDDELYVPPPV